MKLERKWGNQLRTLLGSDEVFHLLGPYQCGWMDGGCGILADALAMYVPGATVVAIVGKQSYGFSPMVQHLLVKAGPHYIDADGVSTKAALLHRWRDKERIVEPRILDEAACDASAIDRNEDLSYAVANVLKARLPLPRTPVVSELQAG